MTHDDAAKACIDLLQSLGERHARRIMGHVMALGLEPDAMEAMVDSCIEDFRIEMRAGGVTEHDVDVAAQHLLGALVKEGGRLARNMSWEEGHA